MPTDTSGSGPVVALLREAGSEHVLRCKPVGPYYKLRKTKVPWIRRLNVRESSYELAYSEGEPERPYETMVSSAYLAAYYPER